MSIPEQLQKYQFRFVRIAMEGENARKRPLDVEWIHKNNYSFTDQVLINWILKGNNYGVVCGHGNLAVLDADEDKIELFQSMRLPRTFTVQTGSGGRHYYYIIPDFEKKIKLIDSDEKHYGEIQWMGQQVIGPGSLHPSGNTYTVIDDMPLTQINNTKIQEIFQDWIKQEQPIRPYQNENTHKHVDMTKIVNLDNFRQKGGEYVGRHPVHGSKTGGNFSINIESEVWHCFRCGTGGGPVTLIAMLEGLIKCNECRPGVIDNAIYQKVLTIAKEKYGVEIDE